MRKFFRKYHYVILILIISFAFFTRIVRIHVPERYIFDEVYHALTSKLIARNDVRAYEWWNKPVEPDTAVDWLHPPYAKYTQAFFIKVFGENSFGWRISSVIFGVLVIVLVYKLSEELFEDKEISLLATFLASLDGLLLVQSRIAMNDIHVTFFILLTFLFYLRYRKKRTFPLFCLTGIAAGFAMGTKWSGLFALLTVGFFETVDLLGSIFSNLKNKIFRGDFLRIKKILLMTMVLIILPVVMYVLSYSHMFIQGKSFICHKEKYIQGECYFERVQIGSWKWEGYTSHFGELHKQIWWYQTNLEATHTYQSRPLQWFFNLRPVWMHVNYQNNMIANTYAQGNTALFWIGDIAIISSVIVFFITLKAKLIIWVRKVIGKKKNLKKKHWLRNIASYQFPKYFFFLLFAYFAVWLPWQLSPRIMFFYHYTPAVPLLSIILAYWLIKLVDLKYKKIKIGQLLLIFVLTLCSANFLVFYPNWTAIMVPKDWANKIYFALKSWK